MTASTDTQLTEALRARGQRVTPQRLLIHRALREMNRHVSVEEVLSDVVERLPNVSLPTVYATLELLEELGLVRRVGEIGGRVLFDSRLDDHHHAVCSRCGRIEDIDAAVDAGPALEAASAAGFAGGRAGLIVTGLCARCGAADGPYT
ncbi:MAG: Fur family transcriptional regulator, stress-responsive regulator [Thermoleophilaceae bacterium]|jgi:Fe2+ or Zn2+ uptake regulation protein|nr:Fur family transcriptional regulator, stress-responsive regulator [Thermoleophilaceae bacterium]